MTEVFELTRIPTPVGEMLIATDIQGRLRVLDWETHAERMLRLIERHYGKGRVTLKEGPGPHAVVDKLKAYVAGDMAALADRRRDAGEFEDLGHGAIPIMSVGP